MKQAPAHLPPRFLALGLVAVLACASETTPATDAGVADGAARSDASPVADTGPVADGGPAADTGPVADTGVSTDAGTANGDATEAAVQAANAFLAALSESQRAAVSFSYTDAAQKVRWSNFPTGIFQRAGVKLGDLTTAQADAGFAILRALLSTAGYTQIQNIVAADQALAESSGGGNLTFGRAEYFFGILGTPSTTSAWRLQFGGHHLALNITVKGSQITLAPSLTGAQPASFTVGGVTVRPQGGEIDLAFALINALSAEQKAQAIIGASYIDLVLGPGQDGRVLSPEGIQANALDAAQRQQLLQLIRARVGLVNDATAAARMAQIEATLDDTYFAWSGPTTAGSAAYWRITGPTLAIEYSPQQLGGSATNHTHAMYRDPTNDYGDGF